MPAPPDSAATAAELEQLRGLTAQRDAAALTRIQYWGHASPSYRWNDMLTDISAANPIPGGGGLRAFAMMNVAVHDAMIAAWDSKYAYNRPRPAVEVQPPRCRHRTRRPIRAKCRSQPARLRP